MDPQQLAQFIGSTPMAPAANQQPGAPAAAPAMMPAPAPSVPSTPIFQPSAQPMFTGPTQPPAYGAPAMPATTPATPAAQPAQPGQTPTEYSLSVPGVTPQAPQVPEWAQTLVQQVADLQQKVVQPPAQGQVWDDNNRPRSWEELQKSIEKMADDKAEARVQAFLAEQQQQQQAQQTQQTQVNQQLDAIEGQLVQTGLLPAVVNPNDPNDPGRASRQELYAYALSIGGTEPQHLGPAAATLKALHDTGWYFDRSQNKLVQRNSATPNAYAPIAGGAPTMTGGPAAGTGAVPTTRQLSTMDLSSIVAMGAQSLGLS